MTTALFSSIRDGAIFGYIYGDDDLRAHVLMGFIAEPTYHFQAQHDLSVPGLCRIEKTNIIAHENMRARHIM